MAHKSRLENILHSMGSMLIVLDDQGIIKTFNREAEQITGYKDSEVIGSHFAKILLHHEDLEHVTKVFNDLINTKQNSEYQNYILTKDGERRFISFKNTVILKSDGAVDYVVSSGVDITKQFNAEQELKHSEELNRTLINKAPFGILITQKHKIRFCNESFAKIIGIDLSKLLERPLSSFCPDSHKHEIPNKIKNLLSRVSDFESFESKMISEDRGVIPVKINIMMIQYNGDNAGLAFIEDLMDRKLAEKEDKLLQEQILKTEKLQSLKSLSSGIAHEFNNILTGIIGNLYLTELEFEEKDIHSNSVHEIKELAFRAKSLIERLQAYSGEGRGVMEHIDLSSVIIELKPAFKSILNESVKVEYYLDPNLMPFEGDLTQVKQVIINILENANEAISEDNGLISIKTFSADLDESDIRSDVFYIDLLPGHYVGLEMSDNGLGIKKEHLQQIFDPFFSTKFTGRGMGLGIVQGIIRGHNGSIRVNSEVGKGTTIVIYFPVLTHVIPDLPYHAKGTSKTQISSNTVLVVDDEPTIRNILYRFLSNKGYNVILAEDGFDALHLYSKFMDEISLVILDITMPKMNGIEVLRKMKILNENIPVLLMSGYTESDVLKDLNLSFISGFLKKPFDLETLTTKIENSIELRL